MINAQHSEAIQSLGLTPTIMLVAELINALYNKGILGDHTLQKMTMNFHHKAEQMFGTEGDDAEQIKGIVMVLAAIIDPDKLIEVMEAQMKNKREGTSEKGT